MKFVLETVTKCSGRTGTINGIDKLSNVKLQTPGLILHTKGGSVPYLSKDVFKYTKNNSQFMQYSLTNTEHMQDAIHVYGEGISGFTGQKDSMSLLILRDPSELCQTTFHEKDLMPIYGRSGKKNFNSEQYMELVEAFKPAIYVPLYDGDTDGHSSKKREQKSVDRTEKFVEHCLKLHRKSEVLKNSTIIGPIVGGYNMHLREQSIKFLSQFEKDLGGYLIAGIHSNGSSATEINASSVQQITSSICQSLPQEKVRFAFGAFSPNVLLQLVSSGVDVFDTSYAYLKTQQNRALNFSYDTDEIEVENREMELDMKDSRWAEDFTGFVSSCHCLACKQHTKAYSHHLYNTRELLSSILLMIHNLHHYFEFFNAIRKHVETDTIPKLVDHLNKQRECPIEQNVVVQTNDGDNNSKEMSKKVRL
ncbi:queuine tRNA-ribosyltransferase accessory subunit 2 [Toxorhynchites rutilus septentrionalis]|uniref:queuine tRNA-ribosyltransferase accessory subunit 2 n=1 Tax=Toxorhynchites rutilus septentrionalis TaxID=329112 RepID=UPI00247A7E0E|nr:queuine tRNA-ribosyltransferase accessory subunit 2 [Toxorhynchites rutilus septentrionalis]